MEVSRRKGKEAFTQDFTQDGERVGTDGTDGSVAGGRGRLFVKDVGDTDTTPHSSQYAHSNASIPSRK